MSLTEQERKRLIALTRQMKEQKGITIKEHEIKADLNKFKQAQKEILDIKKENADLPVVVKAADESNAKLQKIIDQLNDYMGVLYPEGLIELNDGGLSGKTSIASG